MARNTKKKNAPKSAKCGSAEKRKTQTKKTNASRGKGAKPTLANARSNNVVKESSSPSKSTSGANGRSQQAAPKNGAKAEQSVVHTQQRSQPSKSSTGAKVPGEQAAPKVEDERQGILIRLIETLKRVIGYKKGERDEFRYNLETEHPNYIFEQSGKKIRAMGLTHKNETFGKPNMPLKNNPDPTDKEEAYIRNGIITQKGRMGKKRLKHLKFSDDDKSIVKSKKRNYRKVRKIEAQKKRQAKKKKGK
ncbi:MAG: hypothetical protein ACI4MB_05765 [Candidatus Coproplasma sp.]